MSEHTMAFDHKMQCNYAMSRQAYPARGQDSTADHLSHADDSVHSILT